MNHEKLQLELSAVRLRINRLAEAEAKILYSEAQMSGAVNLDPVVDVSSLEKTYSPDPATVTSIEEHQARKTVEEVYRQQDSFPLPQDNNLAA